MATIKGKAPAAGKPRATRSAAPATRAPAPEAPAVAAAVVQPASVIPTPSAAVPAVPMPKDETMTTIETATEKAKSFFNGTNATTGEAFAKTQKVAEELTALGKGHVEALVESAKIAAKGAESMSQDAAEYAKTSFEHATAAMKSFASAKSPTEFLKLQSDYVRESFDAMVAHTSRSTETALKLAGEVAQPISNRVAVAMEKAKVAA